jgi:glutathione S-transferase
MQSTTFAISGKNYFSWLLRGWLMTKLSGLDFEEIAVDSDDAAARGNPAAVAVDPGSLPHL